MARSTRDLKTLSCCLLALTVLVPGAQAAAETPTRDIGPGMVVMGFPQNLGAEERPPIEFNHRAHTTILGTDGCPKCHVVDDKGLSPALAATTGIDDRDRLIDAFHNNCLGCHKERAAASLESGPITCGECHVRRGPGVSQRLAMSYDYSLHGRHSLAFEDKCESCHHVYDEAQQKLVYVKGQEDGCPSCHGASDEESKPSLRNASHRGCVSCHLQRIKEQLSTGPILCVGCHDATLRSAIRQLESPPRLLRGQADSLWVHAPEGTSKAVPFNHLAHEQKSQSCSQCHHQSLRKCSECHTTVGGAPEGGGVILERAFHMTPAAHSCVGCHRQHTTEPGCAGCHTSGTATIGEQMCNVCHSGPTPATIADNPPPPPAAVEATLGPLPVSSNSFPEEVTIDILVDEYEASKLPHLKIVAKLDTAIRNSSLARRFHGTPEIMCASCHHHSPAGSRPPKCRACHTMSAHSTHDMPGLKAAYHRQCIGCHQRMGIDKQGCTDCHAEREVQS